MLNLTVYSKKDLQNFKSFLNQCESVGVSDIRFVRQRIEDFIHNDLVVENNSARKLRKQKQYTEPKDEKNLDVARKCRDCGRIMVVTGDGETTVYVCGNCRYSEVA